MGTDNMNAVPKSIEGVLTDNPKMKIPIFQRDYSWKQDNWVELWNDIKNGFENNNKHYLGSVVLVKNSDYKEVVDGQQRLTTISIIYLAIISNFNELINNGIDVQNNITRAQGIKKLICETDLYNITSTNKLELNETNNIMYSQYLVNDNLPTEESQLTMSNKLLIDCFKYFKKELKKACTEAGKKNASFKLLLDYFKYISQNLILIEITASDYHNAYVIFETLNDRGLDLTVTDLLKNYLFSKIKNSKHSLMKRMWSSIVNNVDERNTTKYIRHYWNSYHKKVTEKELFKVIKDSIDTEEKVLEFVKQLNECSYIYSALSNPKSQIWNGDASIVKSLEEIKLYKVDLCYPVLLSAQLFISNLDLKRKIFRLCSRISFRYIIICNGSANDLERAYNDLCLAIAKYKNELDFSKVEKDMKEFIVSKEEFIASFKNKVIKTKNNKRLITEILKGIEKCKGTQITDDNTIEHILPESFSEEWNNIFINDAEEYVYRLGNYILLEREANSEIGNDLFDIKKEAYIKSRYKDANKISKLTKWDIHELENHQKEMAIIVESVWSL
ncbi:DUF262 domain-containing HNH endonuclease family protein [Clostridium sp. DSM 100503]|uniref:DUF262 domain-containing protein n=1 Tax=Clostridium sp. DSM 100503 TaxID=2963282 RepID=UPI00214A1897|nr:DUF262 domain-containing HNH endonuclease family protein [Clostridium sp. DSM 100503]MCR1950015.1 DUF262 domain-containing HNH endonuclease family protein [Clostridium sp. DSM 100503]